MFSPIIHLDKGGHPSGTLGGTLGEGVHVGLHLKYPHNYFRLLRGILHDILISFKVSPQAMFPRRQGLSLLVLPRGI